ncbi:unnamed protein product [Rotaria sp. Silwood2]|nr:unnamed protein product [Rotaria sp. Silwood2]
MNRAPIERDNRRRRKNRHSSQVTQSTDDSIALNDNQLFPTLTVALSNIVQLPPKPESCSEIQIINSTDTVNDHSVSKPKTAKEELVIDQVCKIILTIHARQEFVSVQRVEQELFEYFGVHSFRELGVDQRNLTPLTNLIQRHKSIILYMQIFERVFNLCTLHDLDPMLAKFLKLQKYDDAHLGPLDKHPDVKRIFQYKRPTSGNAITEITTGNVINAFLDFQAKYHGPMRMPFDEFLEELVKEYKLENREQLGIFCRSFPYLTQVTRKLTQEHRIHTRQSELNARSNIIQIAQQRFVELIKELKDEFQISLDKKKKSSTAVFDHLISIVEKYLIVSEQQIVRDTLNKFRKDELLQCLFNVSICLGTIKKPDELMIELKKFYQYPILNSSIQPTTMKTSQLSHTNQLSHNKQHQSMSFNQISPMQNTVMRTTVDTSFENTLLSSSLSSVAKPRITLKQLCIDLGQHLKRYDNILTIKQWSEVEKTFCSQHGIENFFGFCMINEDNGGHLPLSLISFLHMNRQRIDPNGQLSVYENVIPTSNRRELYTFVNQLLRTHDNREEHTNSNTSTEISTNRPICFSADQLSAIEKGIKHKFGGLLGFQGSTQIINKAKQQQQTNLMIYFEESLLDVVSLNRLDICPSTLPVDEAQLCKLILQCPIMIDLNTWLQWLYFFQPKYGSLKMFITRKQTELDGLLLLETSTHELFRLPIDSSLTHFEQELAKMNVRSAIGYLCTSIILEHIQVNRLPLSIYRQVMHTWFVLLQSSATFGHEPIEPMQYILDFLIYLPVLIGQKLIVQELVLAPLDDVFRMDDQDKKLINNREKLWSLANDKQKNKLEIWGYLLDIKEWRNTTKWTGQTQSQIEPTIKQSVKVSNTTEITVKV